LKDSYREKTIEWVQWVEKVEYWSVGVWKMRKNQFRADTLAHRHIGTLNRYKKFLQKNFSNNLLNAIFCFNLPNQIIDFCFKPKILLTHDPARPTPTE
jgi:hypothetical protein